MINVIVLPSIKFTSPNKCREVADVLQHVRLSEIITAQKNLERRPTQAQKLPKKLTALKNKSLTREDSHYFSNRQLAAPTKIFDVLVSPTDQSSPLGVRRSVAGALTIKLLYFVKIDGGGGDIGGYVYGMLGRWVNGLGDAGEP